MADEAHNTLVYTTHASIYVYLISVATDLYRYWSIIAFNLFDEHLLIWQTDLKYHMTKSLFILFLVCSSE